VQVKDKKYWLPGLPKNLYYPQVPLFTLLETSARYYPQKTAVNYYGNEMTYSELFACVEKMAASLAKKGVKKGDRVALFMQNSPHFIISYYGIMKANAVVVPLNPMLVEEELFYLLQDSGSDVVITTADLAGRVINVKKKLPIKEVIVGSYSDYLPKEPTLPVPAFMQALSQELPAGVTPWHEVMKETSPPPLQDTGYNDLCLLPYTSGSTGDPKGCMHTHATVMSNLISAYHWVSLTASCVCLAVLPFFHVTGLIHNMMAPLYAGATVMLMTRWDRQTALEAIEKYRCTHWINISTMVVDILSAPDIMQRDLSSLLSIGGGGAPLPAAIGEKLEQIAGLKYIEGYGLTETISQTHKNPPPRPKRQCLGIPDFGVDARIIDMETGREVPQGKEGELIIDGPEVFIGYWNKPEETEKAFMQLDGRTYFRTGDVCYMDEEGYYFLVDRTKRMINAAGFKVWPAEVENHLYRHPDILEACVVGVPDPKRGEEVRAYVVLKEQTEGRVKEEEIITWCKEQMSAYKYPRQIRFIEALPKSGTGKIQWRTLQETARKEFE